jgi:hypothetical protein
VHDGLFAVQILTLQGAVTLTHERTKSVSETAMPVGYNEFQVNFIAKCVSVCKKLSLPLFMGQTSCSITCVTGRKNRSFFKDYYPSVCWEERRKYQA